MTLTSDMILAVGRRYLTQVAGAGDCEPERELLLALGAATIGEGEHKRAVWLCWLSVRRVLEENGRPAIGPADDVIRALELVDGWLVSADSPQLVEWVRACHIDDWCSGKPCNDDEGGPVRYGFSISRMVSGLCRFAFNGGIWDGVEVLQAAMSAGIPYREHMFQSWLVKVALPAAYELRTLSPAELRGLAEQDVAPDCGGIR